MKILNTPEQVHALVAALKPLHVKLFTHESGDPKYNAQRNLAGRTHYVDTDTLRFHHSRINGSGIIGDAWGLLFRLTESCSLDMRNTSRGFRCAVFDVFGTVVYRVDLDQTFTSSRAAEKACNATEFDLVEHYRKAINDKLAWTQRDADSLASVFTSIMSLETGVTA